VKNFLSAKMIECFVGVDVCVCVCGGGVIAVGDQISLGMQDFDFA